MTARAPTTFPEPVFAEDPVWGRVIHLDVPESDHKGPLDPVPHAIRWANARGLSLPAFNHDWLGPGKGCRFVFAVVESEPKPPEAP